MPLDSKLVSN